MTVGLSLGADRWRLIRRGVAWTPAALFAAEAYGWAIVAPNTVWADTAGTTPGVVDQTIRRLDDQRGAPWIGATTGPTYRVTDGINWLEFAQINGWQLTITVPAITNGTLMLAHKNAGVMSGNVSIPAGTYSVGRWDLHGIVGILLIDRDLSQAERDQVRQWFVDERGAGATFGGVTNFDDAIRELRLTSVDLFDTSSGAGFSRFMRGNLLTTVPLFDTSSGTSFSGFLQFNRLTTVPLFDTSSGTSFSYFLQNNPLTTVPAGLFDDVKGTNFSNAFLDCTLTQQSVDNVLVSIATAAAANNLNNGNLSGLDSGANSAPSATGVAAKNELIARGWTVSTF